MRRRPSRRHAVPAAPKGRAGVLLAWARDRHGQKIRADRLAASERRSRAPFSCLGCGEELVPHLGRLRAAHFAHRPGSTCPLTAPETALHQDAKERLLELVHEAMAGQRRVRVVARCPECRRPSPLDVGGLGDTAEQEGAVGALRADVLIRAGGRPALAIEVRVTHAVEPDKEAALRAAGVPAVEVDAREEWEGPLAAGGHILTRAEAKDGVDIVCSRGFGLLPCSSCRARARALEERELGGEAGEIAELEAYRARGLWGRTAGCGEPNDPESALTEAERRDLSARFTCPDCRGTALVFGSRIARHSCADPDGGEPLPARPVAWRGYDGSLVSLGWWLKSARARSTEPSSRARQERLARPRRGKSP
ncbi:MAG TPA: competence protein CoiA family protein [Anaeromyxobacter sp.]|nr:competence protein CoiA family protein [Anaeromyxobacter sp.]